MRVSKGYTPDSLDPWLRAPKSLAELSSTKLAAAGGTVNVTKVPIGKTLRFLLEAHESVGIQAVMRE